MKQKKKSRDNDLAFCFPREIVETSRAKVEAEEVRMRMEMEEEKRRRRICDFSNEDILGGRISL